MVNFRKVKKEQFYLKNILTMLSFDGFNVNVHVSSILFLLGTFEFFVAKYCILKLESSLLNVKKAYNYYTNSYSVNS